MKAQHLELENTTTTGIHNHKSMNNKLDKTTEATKDLSGETGAAMRILAFYRAQISFVSASLSEQANTLASNRRRSTSSVSHQGFVANECAVMEILGKSSFSESILPHIGTAIH